MLRCVCWPLFHRVPPLEIVVHRVFSSKIHQNVQFYANLYDFAFALYDFLLNPEILGIVSHVFKQTLPRVRARFRVSGLLLTSARFAEPSSMLGF